MKKILLLLLCTATLGLASCEKTTVIDDQGLPNQTIETVINPGDWRSVENGTRLTATLNFPEIDSETFKNDGLMVYIYPDNEVNEYKQLPFVFDKVSYSYTARPGSITFDIQTSNNDIPLRPSTARGIRVVIVTSSLD